MLEGVEVIFSHRYINSKIPINDTALKSSEYQIFFFPNANPGSFTYNGNWADIVANRIFFLPPGTEFSVNCEGSVKDCFHIGFESLNSQQYPFCYISIIPQEIKNEFLNFNIKLSIAYINNNQEQKISSLNEILLCLDYLVTENRIIFAARHVGRVVSDVPKHFHASEYQVEYFNEGAGSINIENRLIEYKRGFFCFIPPLASHEIIYPKSNDIDNYTVKFKFPDDSKYKIVREFFVTEIPEETRPKVLGLLKKIVGEFVQDIPISSDKLINFVEIINSLKKNLIENDNMENMLVHRIKHIVSTNQLRSLRITNIAAQLGLSHEHISRQFKKHTEQTLISYINSQRLQLSLMRIKNTDMPVKQIAIECGFKNVNYFYAIFKKYFSFTPHDIRKGADGKICMLHCNEKNETHYRRKKWEAQQPTLV